MTSGQCWPLDECESMATDHEIVDYRYNMMGELATKMKKFVHSVSLYDRSITFDRIQSVIKSTAKIGCIWPQ